MKRKELLAKSLAVGLAVALAASSVSAPGGLLAPIDVMAADAVTTDSFQLTKAVIADAATLGSGIAVKDLVTTELSGFNREKLTVTAKDSDDAAVENGTIKKADTFKIFIAVEAHDNYEALAETELGTVTVYGEATAEQLGTLKYTVENGAGETNGLPAKDVNGKVTLKADGSDTIAVYDDLDALSEGTGADLKSTVEITGTDTVKRILLLKSGEASVAKEFEVTFDTTKPEISKVEPSNAGVNGITLTVTATDASTSRGKKLSYALSVTDNSDGAVEDLTGAEDDKTGVFTLGGLTADTTYKYSVTVTDEAGNESAASTGTFTTGASESGKTPLAAADFTVGPDPVVAAAADLDSAVKAAVTLADGEHKDYSGAWTLKYKKAASDAQFLDAITESGKYLVYVTAEDTNAYAGLTEEKIGELSVYEQVAAPTFTYAYADDGAAIADASATLKKADVKLTKPADYDAIKVVSAVPAYDLGNVTGADGTFTAPAKSGPQTITVLLKKDNKLTVTTVKLTFDADVPSIQTIVPEVGSDSAKITVTATDKSDATLTYKLTDGSGNPVAGVDDNQTGVFELTGLTPETSCSYKVIVTDAVGNTAEQAVSFTTLKAAFDATLSFTKDGEAFDGTPAIGDTLKVVVSEGTGYTYKWSRIKADGSTEACTNGESAEYSVTEDDAGLVLTVVVTSEDGDKQKSLSTKAVAKKASSAPAESVFVGVTGEGSERVLNVTVPAGSTYEYQIGNGSWQDVEDGKIPVGETAHEAGTIKVRVKETVTASASEAVAYGVKIEASSSGGDDTDPDTPDTPSNPGSSSSGSSSGGSSSGSSSGGSSSTTTTTPKTETKPDGTVVTTTEEKKADGTTVTTTEEKKTDGTTTKTTEEKKTDGSTTTTTEEKKTDGSTTTTVEEKKADGSSTTTTDEKKADGTTTKTVEEKKADGTATVKSEEKKADGSTTTAVEEKAADGSAKKQVEIRSESAKMDATVNVTKNTAGKVTEAEADVIQTVTDKKAVISAAVVNEIAQAAGTRDVVVTNRIVGTDGKTVCRVTVNLSDLSAGEDMKVLKVNKETGKWSLINKSTYTVNADGSIALTDLKTANYVLVPASEADAFGREVLKTVQVKQSKKSLTVGKKTKIALKNSLNMDNVAKVTYTTSKKSVATVNKNGTVKAKKAGKATVKAKVTLKNGKSKTVKMTITIKKKK